MGRIRPLTEDDAGAVAALFQRIFRRRATPPPAALLADIRAVYLEDESCGRDLPSLVQVEDDGTPSGFIGRHALPMTLDGRPLRMALCSSIMVDREKTGPLTGAKLLKAALEGPQDFSFTDTASDVSLRMWRGLGGVVLPSHSLDWVRIIDPAVALLDGAAYRFPFLQHLRPLARMAGRRIRGRVKNDALRWTVFAGNPKAVTTRAISAEEFAAVFAACIARFPLRPGWSEEETLRLAQKAMAKPAYGQPVIIGMFDRMQAAIGAGFYHLRPNSSARVLQLLALPGQEGAVVDALLADAATRGASLVRGRMQPAFMDAMLGRRLALVNTGSSIVHSSDEAILARVRSGEAFLNGLAGEQWSRLIGGAGR